MSSEKKPSSLEIKFDYSSSEEVTSSLKRKLDYSSSEGQEGLEKGDIIESFSSSSDSSVVSSSEELNTEENSGSLKRKFDDSYKGEIGESYLEKYRELADWIDKEDSEDINEDLLESFLDDLSNLNNDEKKTNETKKQKIEGKCSSSDVEENPIENYKISFKDIVKSGVGKFSCFNTGDEPKVDLVIQLPTRGADPDLEMKEFLKSLSTAINDLPDS